MAARDLFLELPPELGGVRFGPFPGTVTVGSDPKRAQLVVDPSHGVYPVHATVTRVADGSFTIAPSTRDCKLFLAPAGQPHVWPLTGPVRAQVDDVLIVGTPAGPRFRIVSDTPRGPAPTATQLAQTARATGEGGFVDGMSALIDGVTRPAAGLPGEVQRQLTARVLARPGPLRTAYHAWGRLRSGTLFTPYVLVGIAIAVIGVVGTGSVSCSGLLWVLVDAFGLHR
ncbi:MAG: hypothetical protein ABMB14_08700 [Myxococcota bacterium]